MDTKNKKVWELTRKEYSDLLWDHNIFDAMVNSDINMARHHFTVVCAILKGNAVYDTVRDDYPWIGLVDSIDSAIEYWRTEFRSVPIEFRQPCIDRLEKIREES